jgi:RNA polymerase sigma factor (sigma-70 family)
LESLSRLLAAGHFFVDNLAWGPAIMATAQFGAMLRHIRALSGERPDEQYADGELLDAFRARGDQAAFGLILRRHGPMVLRVCRRALGDLHDAEDVFQATFLFLAQQAGSLRKKASLASWLHGVALRMAANARRSAARRTRHERQPAAAPPRDPAWQAAWHEVQAILDDEIQRLPDAYREPLVRCCLEHRSCAEVAAHLGLREPAVRARLSRGRKLLERRLAKRGVSLTVLTAALAVSGSRATAAVTPALLNATAAAAAQAVSPQGLAAGAVSAPVAALVRGASRALAVAKVKAALAVLMGTLLLAGGTALVYGRALPARGGDERAGEAPPARQGDGPPPPAAPRTDPDGDPLPDGALARLGSTRFRPGDHVPFLRFTPDGSKLVTQSDSGLRVWDAANGRELRRFGPACGIASRGVDLSADGKLALTADNQASCTLRLWDVGTGKELRQCGSTANFGQARLAPDGKTVAATAPGGEVELRDVTTGERRHTLKGQDASNALINFSADGKTLVVGADKTIRLWDVATGEGRRRVDCPEPVALVALSPDGKLLASVGYRPPKAVAPGVTANLPDNRVRVWDATTGKELRSLVPDTKATAPPGLVAVAFAPDGKTAVTIGIDNVLRVWDAATGRPLRSFVGCSTNLGALALSADGKLAAFANGGTAVRVLDLATGKDRGPAASHGGGVYAAAVTPDGRTVFTAGGDNVIFAWDAATGKEVRRLLGSERWVAALALSPDGRLLYSGGADGKLRVWQTADGKERPPLAGDGNASAPRMLALSADGKLLVTTRAGKGPGLIDAASGQAVRPLAWLEGRSCRGAGFAADGRTLVAWDEDQEFHIFDVATGKSRGRFPFAGDEDKRLSYAAAVSPDGGLIAFGSQGRFLVVREVETGKEVCRFDRLPDGVSALAFSPDGRSLAWGGWADPTVHLIELATRGERHHFTGHRGRVLSLHFSPDGRVLVSGGNDATALVWDLAGAKAGGKEISAEETAALWEGLGAADAAPAYQTVRRLARSPAAVKFLGKQVRPAAAADQKQVARLIADLDSDEFDVRDGATKELERLGEQAAGAYRKALDGRPSAEVRRRLEGLLERQAAEARRPSDERVRLLRALEALELAGTGDAREALAALAGGAPGAWLTEQARGALGRLDRRAAAARAGAP